MLRPHYNKYYCEKDWNETYYIYYNEYINKWLKFFVNNNQVFNIKNLETILM